MVGLLLAVGMIVPPAYVYANGEDFGLLFPVLDVARDFLERVTEARLAAMGEEELDNDPALYEDENPGGKDSMIKQWEPSPRQTYK